MKCKFCLALLPILFIITSCNPIEQDIKKLISEQNYSKADSLIQTISDQELKKDLILQINSDYFDDKKDSTEKWRLKEELNFRASSSENFHEKAVQLVKRAEQILIDQKNGHYSVYLNLETWHFIYDGLAFYNKIYIEDLDFSQNFGYNFQELDDLPNKMISSDSVEVQQARYLANQVLFEDKRKSRQKEVAPLSLSDLNYNLQSMDITEKLDQIDKNNKIIKNYYENHKNEFNIIAEYGGIRLYGGPILVSIEVHNDGSIGYNLLKKIGNKYEIVGRKYGDFFEVKGSKILQGDDDGYL